MHDVACEFALAVVRSKDAQKQLARTSLICTSEFFKKLKLHEPFRRVQFRFLKNSQVQINSKLNEKNRMITY